MKALQWSKLKKLIESNFSESLKGRVEIFLTHYRSGRHDAESEFWISVDKERIFNATYLGFTVESAKLAHEIQKINDCENYRDQKQKKGYYQALDDAKSILNKKDIFSDYAFSCSLMRYLSLSIEDALNSKDTIIKALAMLDKRLGKRRLSDMTFLKSESELVKRLYCLRCEAEGLEKTNI